MNSNNSIIKVTFLLGSKAPVNLKPMEYFVKTGNYVIAENKSIKQLKLDLVELSERFNQPVKRLLSYYGNTVMTEIDLIDDVNSTDEFGEKS